MRVAHVINGLSSGGVERLCLSVVQNPPTGIKPVVISGHRDRLALLSEFEAAVGPQLLRLPVLPTDRIAFVSALADALRTVRPDGIICYSFGLFHLMAGVAARRAGVKGMVVSAGNTAPTQGAARQRWREVVWLSRLLGVRIASASGAVESSLRELGKLPNGSRTVPNGVDLERFRAVVGHPASPREGVGPVIGMVARLDPIKDQATLIHAFARLTGGYPGATLWIVGDGSLQEDLVTLSRELGLADRVRFWG